MSHILRKPITAEATLTRLAGHFYHLALVEPSEARDALFENGVWLEHLAAHPVRADLPPLLAGSQ